MTTYKLTGEGYVLRDGDTKVPTSGQPEYLEINPDWVAYRSWLAEGNTPEPADVPPLTVADLDAALTAHLDATAQAQRWDNRINLAVRAGYPNIWQQDAIAFGVWMDQCNALAYQALADVQAGNRPMPTATQELIDALPPMVWPGATA